MGFRFRDSEVWAQERETESEKVRDYNQDGKWVVCERKAVYGGKGMKASRLSLGFGR